MNHCKADSTTVDDTVVDRALPNHGAILTVGRLAASLVIVAALAGCVTVPSGDQQQRDLIAEKLDSYVFENDDGVRHDIDDPDVARLWQEFNILRRNGNLLEAREKLEAAIAITPRDAALWSGAAELALEEDSNLRAENFAAKSNFLADVANRPLRYRNWLIIERAREGRGDLLGAREAKIESAKLQ